MLNQNGHLLETLGVVSSSVISFSEKVRALGGGIKISGGGGIKNASGTMIAFHNETNSIV